jgi:hypothetical protein
MVTWNRRLSKAGKGYRRAQPDASLEYLRSFQIRKDRSANGYRSDSIRRILQTHGEEKTAVYWVEDTRSGECVTDPAILDAVIALVNDSRKWTSRNDVGYRWSATGVRFDKTGPDRLEHHNLELQCECRVCSPVPVESVPRQTWVEIHREQEAYRKRTHEEMLALGRKYAGSQGYQTVMIASAPESPEDRDRRKGLKHRD